MAVLLVFGDFGGPAACCHQCVAAIRCFAASFWLPVFGVRHIEQVDLYNSMILPLSTASLCSVCSSKHEAGRRSFLVRDSFLAWPL